LERGKPPIPPQRVLGKTPKVPQMGMVPKNVPLHSERETPLKDITLARFGKNGGY